MTSIRKHPLWVPHSAWLLTLEFRHRFCSVHYARARLQAHPHAQASARCRSPSLRRASVHVSRRTGWPTLRDRQVDTRPRLEVSLPSAGTQGRTHSNRLRANQCRWTAAATPPLRRALSRVCDFSARRAIGKLPSPCRSRPSLL
jgi:hypothetical protein